MYLVNADAVVVVVVVVVRYVVDEESIGFGYDTSFFVLPLPLSRVVVVVE